LADIYYELNQIDKAIESLQNYVSDYRISNQEKVKIWDFLVNLYSLKNDHTGEAQSLVEICKIDDINFSDLSNAIHGLMNIFKDNKTKFQKEEITIHLRNVAEIMNRRVESEGTVSDFTELAWVYIKLNKKQKAIRLVKLALKRNPEHFHARNLAKILKI
jgi:tetratricopeptide (TPR) repeat protein